MFDLVSVADAAPGKKPTVVFSIKDKSGKPILPSEMTRFSLVLAGPTNDYTAFVAEDARAARGGTDGTYSYTFTGAIPANAKGSFSVGMEGYRNMVLLPGTKKEMTVRDAGANRVMHFSVDGSKVVPRRTIVDLAKCNSCHTSL